MGRKKTPAESGEVAPPAEPKEPEAEKEAEEDPPLVKALKVVDDKYLELQREYEKELNELEKRYDERRAPLLEERTKLLTEASGEDAKGKGTPALDGFWLQAMKNHPSLEDKIEDWDEPVLEYLRDITRTNLDPEDMTKGFKLTFHFVENPYFANTVLWKEHHVKEISPYTGDMEATEINASTIDWKPGKNVTVETVKKKVKGGGAKKQKQKNKETEEPRESFFRAFFRNLSPDMPIPDDLALGDMGRGADSDDEDEEMEELMDDDYNCGQDIRDTLIPYAVRWYTGEARPDDDDDDEDDEEEEDDDYEDDDDDDDSEDHYQASGKKAQPKKKGSGGGGGGGRGGGDKKKDGDAGGEQKPEECKQQ